MAWKRKLICLSFPGLNNEPKCVGSKCRWNINDLSGCLDVHSQQTNLKGYEFKVYFFFALKKWDSSKRYTKILEHCIFSLFSLIGMTFIYMLGPLSQSSNVIIFSFLFSCSSLWEIFSTLFSNAYFEFFISTIVFLISKNSFFFVLWWYFVVSASYFYFMDAISSLLRINYYILKVSGLPALFLGVLISFFKKNFSYMFILIVIFHDTGDALRWKC